MPSGTLSVPTTPHKKALQRALSDGDETSSPRSPQLKRSPSMKVVAKKVAKRLDDMYHHVTHTKHQEHKHKERRISMSFSTHSKHSSTSTSTSASSTAPTTPDELPHAPVPIIIIPMADTNPRLPPAIVSDVTPPVEHKKDSSDPFFDDEEGDALSAEEEEGQESPSMQQSITSSAHDVDVSLASPLPIQSPLPNLNKDVPPPPPEEPAPQPEEEAEEEDEEDAAPDIYLPALIVPSMFLPIPNVRRAFSHNLLTWWLSRDLMYNYPRPVYHH
jgi:hypothetical protein